MFLLFLVAIGASANAQVQEVDLGILAENPAAYRGLTVRTCGWARNAFEEQFISIARNPYSRSGSLRPGLGVDWSERARRTEQDQPEWRCIVGRVEPLCDPIEPKRPDAEIVCVSTGSPYQWKIIQIAQD
jgi:hypothetical protein